MSKLQEQRVGVENAIALSCLSLLKINGQTLFLKDFLQADFSHSELKNAKLAFAFFGGTNLSRANLKEANLERANLDLITWDTDTKWDTALGLETATNVPDQLRQQIGLA